MYIELQDKSGLSLMILQLVVLQRLVELLSGFDLSSCTIRVSSAISLSSLIETMKKMMHLAK